MRVIGAATLVAALALAACGNGGDAARAHPRPTTSTTASTSTVPATAPPASTPSPPITIALICSTPSDAAHAFVQAWLAGDRGAAGRCATPDAVAALFAHPGPGAQWVFQQCDGPDPGVPVCTYTYPGGTARLTVTGTEAQGWKVSVVQLG